MKRVITLAACIATLSANMLSAAETVDMQKRAAELKSLKWGMFICWSFSTFSGQEWTPGVKDIAAFRATGCDTDQWARTAKEAGMGYILFLTKHHDGFCLWDTKTTDRKVTKARLGRDVLAELRKSCDKYGIKLALYFSLGEFADNKDYHPGRLHAGNAEGPTQGALHRIWSDRVLLDGLCRKATAVTTARKSPPGSSGFSLVVSSASTAAERATCGLARWGGRARSRIFLSASSPIRFCRATKAEPCGSTRCPGTTAFADRPRTSTGTTAAR